MNQSNNWKCAYYLKKGLSHVRAETACQDSINIYTGETIIAAALCDGLGSLQYSEVAAKITTKTVCEFFKACEKQMKKILGSVETLKEFKEDLLAQIKENIYRAAEQAELNVSDMDCTLTFVCIHKPLKKILIGRVGDSAVCLIKEKESICYNDGNVSANGTSTVMDEDAVNNLELYMIDGKKENIYGILMTSDGLENELYMKRSNHVNKIAEQYLNAVSCSNSLEEAQKRIGERINKLAENPKSGFDDDISLVALSCVDQEITLPKDPTWLCSCGERNSLHDTYCRNCHNDFSKLYRNVVFKEYGGKTAFFEWINQHPEKEKELISQSVVPEMNHPKVDIEPQKTEQGDKVKVARQESTYSNKKRKRKSRTGFIVVLCILCLALGVFVGAFGMKLQMSDQINELEQSVQRLENQVTDLSDEVENSVKEVLENDSDSTYNIIQEEDLPSQDKENTYQPIEGESYDYGVYER